MVEEGANTTDARIARLVARQHGVITTGQLRDLGLSAQVAAQRARAGKLHRLHRGVYAVGHTGLSREGRWMGAVLAIGAGAALSHRSAAELWTLLPFTAGLPHVSVASGSGRKERRGIQVHRTRTLVPADRTRRMNIPVTTPTRTLVDLARVATPAELARARRQAEFLGLPLDEDRLDRAGRDRDGTGRARTELKQRFLRLADATACPLPRSTRPSAATRWTSFGAISPIVETDGWAAHRGRVAFEKDRSRAAALALAGYEVMRVSWRQIEDEPAIVAAAIRSRLRA